MLGRLLVLYAGTLQNGTPSAVAAGTSTTFHAGRQHADARKPGSRPRSRRRALLCWSKRRPPRERAPRPRGRRRLEHLELAERRDIGPRVVARVQRWESSTTRRGTERTFDLARASLDGSAPQRIVETPRGSRGWRLLVRVGPRNAVGEQAIDGLVEVARRRRQIDAFKLSSATRRTADCSSPHHPTTPAT